MFISKLKLLVLVLVLVFVFTLLFANDAEFENESVVLLPMFNWLFEPWLKFPWKLKELLYPDAIPLYPAELNTLFPPTLNVFPPFELNELLESVLNILVIGGIGTGTGTGKGTGFIIVWICCNDVWAAA